MIKSGRLFLLLLVGCGSQEVHDNQRRTEVEADTAAAEIDREESTEQALGLTGNDLELGRPVRPGMLTLSTLSDTFWDGRLRLWVSDDATGVAAMAPNRTPLRFDDINGTPLARTSTDIGRWHHLKFTWPDGTQDHPLTEVTATAPARGFATAHGAIAKNPRAKTPYGQNPYRCQFDQSVGSFPTTFAANGRHLCYEAVVFSTVSLKKDKSDKKMTVTPARVVLETYDAAGNLMLDPKPVYARMSEAPAYIRYKDGTGTLKHITAWEPSATADGRLLFVQGKFTYNFSQDFSPDAWSEPKNPSHLYAVNAVFQADSSARRQTFKDLYPIARKPLLDAFGNPCGDPSKSSGYCGGSYPWISRDGSDLMYAGLPTPLSLSQTGACEYKTSPNAGISIIGVRTNYTEKLIDSHANLNRLSGSGIVNVFGPFGTMWQPFPELREWALPYTSNQVAYGVVTGGYYSEITFEDVQDGHYLVYLPMNELRGRSRQIGDDRANYLLNSRSVFDPDELECAEDLGFFSRSDVSTGDGTAKSAYLRAKDVTTISQQLTPDTSGNFHNAELSSGAFFPQEYFRMHPSVDRISLGESVGFLGRAIFLTPRGSVRIGTQAKRLPLSVKGQTVHVDYNANAQFEKLKQPRGRATVEFALNLKPGALAREVKLAARAEAWEIKKLNDGSVLVTVWDRVGGTLTASTARSKPLLTAANRWHHVGFTFNGYARTLRLFVDGQMVQQTTLPRTFNLAAGAAEIVIGPNIASDPSNSALMLVDEFAYSSTDRTAVEMAGRAFRSRRQTGIEVPRASDLPPSLVPPLGFAAEDMRLPSTLHDTIKKGRFDAARDLGKLVFEDKNLTKKNMACSTCHVAEHAFIDSRVGADGQRLATSLGFDGVTLGPRNAPTIINRAFSIKQFADGRAANLAALVLMPIENPIEMGGHLPTVLADMSASPTYRQRFNDLFGAATPAVNATRLSIVLSAFVVAQTQGNSMIDRLARGTLTRDDLAHPQLSSILRGRAIFEGKGQCVSCHVGANFADELFHNTGTGRPGDQGRAGATGRTGDINKFKTPTLRAIKATAPYFHDGSAKTLRAVIDHYDRKGGGSQDVNLSPEIAPLGLSEQEKRDLEAFMRQL